MIAIPLVISVLLSAAVFFYKGDSTLNRLKSLYDDDKHIDILAYCDHYESGNYMSQIIRDFIVMIGVFAGVLNIPIFLSILLLTRWMSG